MPQPTVYSHLARCALTVAVLSQVALTISLFHLLEHPLPPDSPEEPLHRAAWAVALRTMEPGNNLLMNLSFIGVPSNVVGHLGVIIAVNLIVWSISVMGILLGVTALGHAWAVRRNR
jgi:hypothetical protein